MTVAESISICWTISQVSDVFSNVIVWTSRLTRLQHCQRGQSKDTDRYFVLVKKHDDILQFHVFGESSVLANASPLPPLYLECALHSICQDYGSAHGFYHCAKLVRLHLHLQVQTATANVELFISAFRHFVRCFTVAKYSFSHEFSRLCILCLTQQDVDSVHDVGFSFVSAMSLLETHVELVVMYSAGDTSL